MSEPAVRSATVADADEIAAIHVLSWQVAYRGLMPQEYLDGLDPAQRAERWRRHLEALDWSRSGVLVVNAGGEYRAFQGICSHEYFELDRGFLTGGSLTCALHLSRFDLETGEPLDPPADQPIARYVVVVENGRVQLEAEGPLEVNE